MDKIVGLVKATGSCVWKVQAENYGGFRFESREFFQSAQGKCYPGDFEEASAALQDMCENTVRRSVVKAITDIHANGGVPTIQVQEKPVTAKVVEMPKTTQEPAATPTPEPGKQYQVGEKAAPAAPPQTEATTQAPATTTAKKPQTIIAERLQAAGVTSEELKTAVRVTWGLLPEGQRYTQQQYVDAFTQAEQILKEVGIEQFRARLSTAANKPADPAAAPTPTATAPAAESVVFSTDPAVVEARKQVTAKWPMWGVELVNVASLWCADQLKDAGALEAFLISAEVTPTTPPGRIEALLAIARHVPIGSLPGLINYAKTTKKPMSMIEEELGAAVGKQIRFALDLPNDAVTLALGTMMMAQDMNKNKGVKK